MSDAFWLRSVTEDRDLSRAASERYLMLQALSERQVEPRSSGRHRFLAWRSRAVRGLPSRRADRISGAEIPAGTD
jgi:hypothetical protein